MEREKIIRGLKTLRDNGEVVSQTIILDEAIKILKQEKFFYKGFVIFWSDECKGYVIEGAKDEMVLRTCETFEECKRRIDWQEV